MRQQGVEVDSVSTTKVLDARMPTWGTGGPRRPQGADEMEA